MSADEEFGRAVGEQLRTEVSDVHAAADLAETLRARRFRRTWTLRAAIAAPLAAAAVLVTTTEPGVTNEFDKGGAQAAPPPSTSVPPKVENVAQVQQLTIKALRTANDYVIHEKAMLDTGYLEYWTDRATNRHRMDAYTTLVKLEDVRGPGADTVSVPPAPDRQETGRPRLTESNASEGKPGDKRYISVNYDHKTWSTFHHTEVMPEGEVPDVLDADALKKAIDTGRMELIGSESIDGRQTHHLRLFAEIRGYQIDLWVDSTTYLPVRQTTATLDEPAKKVMTTDYDWLPRDEENLAKLTLTPPPGFVKK
jgi:hypothetical protein